MRIVDDNQDLQPESDSANVGRSQNATRKKLSFRKKLAFLSVAFFVAFLACELLLVVLGISFPLLYQTDEHCGVRLKSNLNVRYIEEGKSIIRTNSAGFRDVERSKSKPDNVFRVAILGDSFCEAIQVEREKSFAFLLEERLSKLSSRNVEVLNFGVSGFGTAQEYELFRHEVVNYQPDLVVLAMFLGNDIGDNSREINPGQIKPYYEFKNGKLVLDDSFRTEPQFVAAKSRSTRFKSMVINNSRTLQLLNKFYSRIRNSSRPTANVGIGLDPNLYRPPEEEEWINAWQITEKLLQEFDRKCKEHDAMFVVLTLSNPIQVHPDPEKRGRFKKKNEISSLFYPDERIRRFCAKSRIKVLQLSQTFYQEVIESDSPVYFHGFENTEMGAGHWNELGHARASELLAKYLNQRIMPKLRGNR